MKHYIPLSVGVVLREDVRRQVIPCFVLHRTALTLKPLNHLRGAVLYHHVLPQNKLMPSPIRTQLALKPLHASRIRVRQQHVPLQIPPLLHRERTKLALIALLRLRVLIHNMCAQIILVLGLVRTLRTFEPLEQFRTLVLDEHVRFDVAPVLGLESAQTALQPPQLDFLGAVGYPKQFRAGLELALGAHVDVGEVGEVEAVGVLGARVVGSGVVV